MRRVAVTTAIAAIAGMVAAVWSASAPVGAGTDSVTFKTTAKVTTACIVDNATLAFGSYDPVVANRSAELDQTATLVLTCTLGATGITISLGNSGNAPAGCTAPQRCMVSAGHYLNYQLYSDSGHASVWTTAIAETVAGGITAPTNVTVYGAIPGGQDATIGGAYADSVTATLNY